MRILIIAAIFALIIGGAAGVFSAIQQASAAFAPETVTLEGHEYYKCRSYGFNFSLCHKGNCKACEAKEPNP